MNIHFIYNKKIDQKCWKRLDDFIKKNGSVWGIERNIDKIISFDSASFHADVSDIIEKYEKFFGLSIRKIKGYLVTTPFSMINDEDEVFSDTIFYSFYNSHAYIVLAHEIFHMFFERYSKKQLYNYEESKEYFTVIMNDIFGWEISKGYPEHKDVRAEVFSIWNKTKSLKNCIEYVNKRV